MRVQGAREEAAYLRQIIETISAGPDLDTILRGVIRLVTEATSCHACFVYFVRDDQLELRAASSIYAHLEGRVTIPLGEGLTGWVAKTRRIAHIRQNALEDPRVRRAYFPELGDDIYQSLASVPIFSRAGDVLGVITLHAEAPHEFTRRDVDLLEHTASLVAGAIENARLYEEATARVRALSRLSELARRISSAGSIAQLVRAMADDTRELLGADRCHVYLREVDDRLVLAAASPPLSADAADRGLRVEAVDLLAPGGEGPARLAELIWGPVQGVPLFAPLVAGEAHLGLLAVLLPRPPGDEQSLLAAITSHAAVAIKQHQLIEGLKAENLTRDLFETLAREPQDEAEVRALAEQLRFDLDGDHMVIHIQAPAAGAARPPATRSPSRGRSLGAARRAAEAISSRLSGLVPGCLFDHRERWTRGLLPLGDRSPTEVLELVRRVEAKVRAEGAPPLVIGLSGPLRGTGEHPTAFREARAAAEVGPLVRGTAVTTHEELGSYRYVLGPDVSLNDPYRPGLERLVEYDRRRKTRLLDTLEAFLDGRGNVIATSRALFIHPNTLRQRLARIERVTGLTLEREDWLSLGLAVKSAKLRERRRQAEGGSDG